MTERVTNRNSRYCQCGAQWHGKYATDDNLKLHRLYCCDKTEVTEESFISRGHKVAKPAHWKSQLIDRHI
jgi:hypothetical protein